MTTTAAPEHGVAIRLDSLTKRYAGATAPAVDRLDLTIEAGELVALVGPSGCGKTTTLKMINRLIEPSAGTVWMGDVDASTLPAHELRRGIGYVIQQTGLFPHRKVGANIATVPRLMGWSRDRTQARVAELAELVGLGEDLLDRYPAALSGGQQQRVGVARALAVDPPVLLMDEPYSAVDPIVRARLQDELIDLQRRVRKTVVLVTHDIDEAIKLADRVAIMEVGGRLEQFDTPAEMLRAPATEFVADFLGEDRAIKRLSLLRVGEIPLQEGPIVELSDTPAAARVAMASHGVDWVGVRDRQQLLGWVEGTELDGQPTMDGLPRKPFTAVFGEEASLKAALDGIMTTSTRVAVIVDENDHYQGMLTADDLADGLG